MILYECRWCKCLQTWQTRGLMGLVWRNKESGSEHISCVLIILKNFSCKVVNLEGYLWVYIDKMTKIMLFSWLPHKHSQPHPFCFLDFWIFETKSPLPPVQYNPPAY